jgi:hypothetical protein
MAKIGSFGYFFCRRVFSGRITQVRKRLPPAPATARHAASVAATMARMVVFLISAKAVHTDRAI